MALQNFKKEIEQFLENLKECMTNPPSSEWLEGFDLDANIDQNFNLEDATGSLIDYWNESVLNLFKNFKEGLNSETSKIHDAAFDFNDKYVSPNPNFRGEKYEDNRTDEIESVLQNNDNLDSTIGEINEKLEGYITRLIMPQYQRRVEIEDLNRNFWVIGQNLTLLNKLLLGGPMEDLLSEITGLWENVYRIWQAILHINNKINNIEDDINELGRAAAKTKIQLAYSTSWGYADSAYTHEDVIHRLYKNPDDIDLELTDTFLFQEGDGRFFGLLPYIEKESIIYNENGDVGYLFSLPYNKTITDKRLNRYTDEELNKIFITDPSATGEIIGIDRKFGNTPARELLKMLRAKNFVLVSPQPKGAIPTLDALVVAHDPLLSSLQFYRDFLYSVINLDNDNPFGDLIDNTFIWLQGGYLEYINFSRSKRWRDHNSIPENIINCFSFLNKFLSISSVFSNTIEKNYELGLNKISDLKNSLLESQNLDDLITDFYKLYQKCVEYLQDQEFIFTVNAPYFEDTYNGIYKIDSTNNPELFCQEFKTICQKYNEKYSVDSNNTFCYIPTIYLFPRRKDLFEGYNLKLDGTYRKLTIVDYSESQIQNILDSNYNSNINWDLLSNTIKYMGFRDSENIDQTFTFLIDRVIGDNEESKKSLIEEDVIKNVASDLEYSGWYIQDEDSCVGNSFLYQDVDTFGVWFDFTADPTKKGNVAISGEINSFTLNTAGARFSWSNDSQMVYTNMVWSAQHIYNVDITIPFSNIGPRPYFDFIRLGKPYPSIAQVINNRVMKNDHLTALNQEDNYISYNGLLSSQSGDEGFCIDGYYGFESLNNYPIGIYPTLPPIKYKYDFKSEYDKNDTNKIIANIISYRERWNGDEEIYYYGNAFYDNLQYQIASTDLINAYLTENGEEQRGGVSEGFTKIRNRNEINNPVINFSYLSSNAYPQEVSILVSKDTTKGKYFRIIEPDYAICEVVKIGDVYPEDITKDKFKPNKQGQDPEYSTGAYGIGSYHVDYIDCNKNTGIVRNCKFVSYYNLSNDDEFWQLDRNELTEDKIKELGISYIKKLYSNINEQTLVVTKMGIKYWTGSSGSQWSDGLVAHLFQIIPKTEGTEPEVRFLTKLWRYDGYWDGEIGQVFFQTPNLVAWRHLDIRAEEKSIAVTEKDGQIIANGDGAITWYDRNIRGRTPDVQNNFNAEAEKRGAWTIGSDGNQERVVAYCNFNINNGEFSVSKPEYYRLVGEEEFLESQNDLIFKNYGEIESEWIGPTGEPFTFNNNLIEDGVNV